MKKKRKRRDNNYTAILFSSFIILALVLVIILEYIDYKKGKESFLFNKIFKIEKKSKAKKDFNPDLIKTLNNISLKLNYFKDNKKIYHIKATIKRKYYKNLLINLKLLQKKYGFNIELSEMQKISTRTIYLYKIKSKGVLTNVILLTIIEKSKKIIKKPVIKKTLKPRIAFIIDDIGYKENFSKKLYSLNIPITASVIPSSPFAYEESTNLKHFGIEELIHLPMQSRNPDIAHPYSVFININSSETQIRSILKKAMATVPYASGINNHMGSLITANKSIMIKVLKIIKEYGYFFIDSRTTAESVAYQIAKKMKIRTAYRDVFLDHTQDYYHSINEIKRLINIALQKKSAIAIGHPFDSTIKAIRDSISFIRSKGIDIVFASELLE